MPTSSTPVPIHPIYFVLSMLVLGLAADLIRRFVPFYRRALQVEAATRLTPLDGLRGILCFAVMYYHASLTQGIVAHTNWDAPPSAFCLLLGSSAVAFFFSITGYLFWSQAIARRGEIPTWSFWRGRIFRIVPLYIFAFFMVLWIARPQINWHAADTYPALAVNGSMGFFAWVPVHHLDLSSINAGVNWTLQYEWLFYLVLPALTPLVRDGGGWRMILIFLGIKRLSGWATPPGMTLFFFPGILAAHVAQWPRVTALLRRRVVAILVMGVAIAMPFVTSSGYSWRALALMTLIFVPVACGNSLLGVLNWTGLRMMGMVSYSVYLLHAMILFESRGWLARQVHSNTQYWFAILGLACIVLTGCSFTFRFIEWPAIQFEKRFRRQPRTEFAKA